MLEFENYDKLFKHIDNNVEKQLPKIADLIKATLEKYVIDFYHSYTPLFYKRTWDLLNSISVSAISKNNDLSEIQVFFDINLIHPKISTFWLPTSLESKRVHHHIDQNMNPSNDIIPFITNDGWKLPNGNKRQGGKFLKSIDSFCNNKSNWIPYLQRLLEQAGLEIDYIK